MTRPKAPRRYAICPDVLWWPTLFPSGEGIDSSAAADCVAIVRDLVQHGGSALSDSGHGPLALVQRAVQDWPAGPRRQIQELFAELYRQRRWVARPPAVVPTDVHGCDWATATVSQSDGVVVPVTCRCGRTHREFGRANSATAVNYWAAPWQRAMLDWFVSVDNSWTPEEFAHVFWQPILRHATTVTVVDRYIGRTHTDNGSPTARRRYRQALRYVVEAWKRTLAPGSMRTLVLVTGDGGGPRSGLRQLYDRLGAIKTELEREGWLSVTLDLRREDPTRLPHERWLHTDQGLWQLGAGLDVFWSNGQLAPHFYTRVSGSGWRAIRQQYQVLARFAPADAVGRPVGGGPAPRSSLAGSDAATAAAT